MGTRSSSFALASDMFEEALSADAWRPSTEYRGQPAQEASEQLAALSDTVATYEPTFTFVPLEGPESVANKATAPRPQTVVWELARPGDRFAVLDRHCQPAYLEQFQLLRTQLLLLRSQAATDDALRSICVTSAVAGEGKSFTARNLAATLAMSTGKRVLLVEMGAWDPAIPAEASGLEAALAHPEDWERTVAAIAGTGLSVMGGPRPGVTIDIEPLPALIRRLRSHFDWVLIDGPSLLSTAAGEWVSAAADATLLVVREGETAFDRVGEALARIPQERLAGVVMNRMAAPKSSWLPRLKIRLRSGRA